MHQKTGQFLSKELFLLALLLLGVPFGVAFQNIAMVLVCGLLIRWYGSGLFKVADRLSLHEKWSVIWATLFLGMSALATVLNFKVSQVPIGPYIIGHLALYALPLLFLSVKPTQEEGGHFLQVRLINGAAGLAALWALCIVSQWIFGWRLEGLELQYDQAFTRARGFVSHPLTLAYVALALLPLSLCLVKYHWRKVGLWAILAAILVAIYFSMSRTVQTLALGVLLWNIFTLQVRPIRYAAMGTLLVGVALLLCTDNLVSQRLKIMEFSRGGQLSEATLSTYPDDRLAFWDIHWQMIKERPFLGHGVEMDQSYRRPYYEAMGLKDFKKPYEAHNQLIQIVAEGGFPALAFFCLWIFCLSRSFGEGATGGAPIVVEIRNQTLVVFLLGGLTQNVYHDSEVRYALMVVLALGFASKNFFKK